MIKEIWKKYWLLIVIAGAGLLAWEWSYFSNPKNKISFGFDSDKDLGAILPILQGRVANTNQSAKNGIGIYLDIPLTTLIKNKSAKEIILNNIAGTLSYAGQSILSTKADSNALKNVTVDGKSQKPVTDTFQILVNGSTIKYIQEYLKGNKPKLNYDLTAMIAGNVYSFKDSAVLNASQPSTGGGGNSGGATNGGRK